MSTDVDLRVARPDVATVLSGPTPVAAATAASALPPARDPSIDEATLADVAAEIRAYAGAAMLEFSCTVGRIVLDRLYRGDMALWHAHGRKDVSLRRLSALLGTEARMSASALGRCVAIHETMRPLGSSGRWRHLTPSHVRAVLPLPLEDRTRILERAEAEGWTTRATEEMARSTGRRTARSSGDARRLVRVLRRLAVDFAPHGRSASLAGKAAEFDAARIEEAYLTLMSLREHLDRLQQELSLKRLGVVHGRRRRSRA